MKLNLNSKFFSKKNIKTLKVILFAGLVFTAFGVGQCVSKQDAKQEKELLRGQYQESLAKKDSTLTRCFDANTQLHSQLDSCELALVVVNKVNNKPQPLSLKRKVTSSNSNSYSSSFIPKKVVDTDSLLNANSLIISKLDSLERLKKSKEEVIASMQGHVKYLYDYIDSNDAIVVDSIDNFYAEIYQSRDSLYSGFDLADDLKVKVITKKPLFGKRSYTVEMGNSNPLLYHGKASLFKQDKKNFIIGIDTRYSWEIDKSYPKVEIDSTMLNLD